MREQRFDSRLCVDARLLLVGLERARALLESRVEALEGRANVAADSFLDSSEVPLGRVETGAQGRPELAEPAVDLVARRRQLRL